MKVYKDKEFRELRPVLVYTKCDFCGKEFKKPGNTIKLDVVNLNEKREYYNTKFCSGEIDVYNGWAFDICNKCLEKHKKQTVFVD